MGGDRGEILRNISLDLAAGVRDDAARRSILALLRVVEIDAETIRQLKEENQRLRDENNRLKGEQGKPNIRPKNKNKSRDVSSERERMGKNGNRNRTKGSKKDRVKVDRTEVCELDRSQLTADAEFKGYGGSRQGCNPAGESPVASISRFGCVAIPQFMQGNHMIAAWCKRPSCSVARAAGWEQPGGLAITGA